MKYDVFISYSRKDTAVADQIAKGFDAAGISYFIDRQGIGGGLEFPTVLANAIVESKVFLFLASKNSYASKFSRSEVVFAFNKKEKQDIIPYIIDGSSLPIDLEFTFSAINWRDMRQHPVETVVEDVLEKIGRKSGSHYGTTPAHEPADLGSAPVSQWRKVWPWVVAALAVALVAILAMRGCGGAKPDKNNEGIKGVASGTAKVEDENTMTDQDGNTYKTVKIGNQVWMAENLRTMHYSDGTSIAKGSEKSVTTAYWYYPNNNSANKSTYGLLYNWKAVMGNASSSSSNPSRVQGICPRGWHVPSDAEWTQLTGYVYSQSQYWCDNYGIAKALASKTGWKSSSVKCAVGNDPSANNATGFSALPAGSYDDDYENDYSDFGRCAVFWSATTEYVEGDYYPYYRNLYYELDNVDGAISDKYRGFSVRCVHD